MLGKLTLIFFIYTNICFAAYTKINITYFDKDSSMNVSENFNNKEDALERLNSLNYISSSIDRLEVKAVKGVGSDVDSIANKVQFSQSSFIRRGGGEGGGE